MKFSQEPMDEPLAVIIDLADLNQLSYKAIYDAIGHIFPKAGIGTFIKISRVIE